MNRPTKTKSSKITKFKYAIRQVLLHNYISNKQQKEREVHNLWSKHFDDDVMCAKTYIRINYSLETSAFFKKQCKEIKYIF